MFCKMKVLMFSSLLLSLGLPVNSYAQCFDAIATTGHLVVSGDGSTAYDNKTDLTWKRCAFGQEWTGLTCTGTATRINWHDAFAFAELEPSWRLPNIKELNSIAELRCSNPMMNEDIFPSDNVYYRKYWSSSTYALASKGNAAWEVDLYSGGALSSSKFVPKGYANHVLLVRSGQ